LFFLFCFYFCIFFLLVGLGFELRASNCQAKYFTTSATPLVHFALVILEIGSHELFAWASLELWSSYLSLPSN
jgi:hypothetical protein